MRIRNSSRLRLHKRPAFDFDADLELDRVFGVDADPDPAFDVDANPDPAFDFNADPDQAFTSIRISDPSF